MSRSSSPIVRWLPHLAAVAVVFMCARLAVWQFDRADEKRRLLLAWEQAGAVALDEAASENARFVEVSARGRFDTDRQVLLDNQVRAGQTGVHVFTPFNQESSDRTWLVNRGWHALASRQGPLPEIEAPGGSLEISGRLTGPPRVGLQLGETRALEPDRWPNLVTYMDLDRVETALGGALADEVILLDPDHPAHLTGDEWQPVNFGPDRHRAYAYQWITMGIVVFLIWVALTWRNLRKS
ncbi:MAG: hypothetical protein GVY11_04330 [Gammaproteobacteria bacterium]|jgi:surfeit locus 1 family protein|nr:hypothetical protein [Gammaproteobacteria bacterium]